VLIAETIRVTKRGGYCLFSTYSSKFWEDRLEWFIIQSDAGLLGEIDYEKTRDGKIVCKDGFVSSSFDESYFRKLAENLSLESNIVEVDESSLFWVVQV
jgi:2-polyprenyl-6-hydroxyphenyl methylase/3-demethylubiquinone-9 3-methyltransferase